MSTVQITRRLAISLGQYIALLFSCTLISAIAEDPPCLADPLWLPLTPAPTFAGPPLPHKNPDCPFYRAAWQTFLFVCQPNEKGSPAFLSYPTIQTTFGSAAIDNFAAAEPGILSLAPRTMETPNGPTPPNGPPRLGSGVTQAGLRGILIDQEGRPIYYAIHMNKAYTKFLSDNHLTTAAGIIKAPSDLEFPKGSVELKSAWKVVSDASPLPDYFTTKADIPQLKVVNNELLVDKKAKPLPVRVALLAIHVVFVLQGHPEFIWATFEHVNANGQPDIAPSAPANPAVTGDPPIATNGIHYVLFKTGTTYLQANVLPTPDMYISNFDPKAQTFTKLGMFQTSIIRVFPASKTGTTIPDSEVEEINASVRDLFKKTAAPGSDKRQFYKLVGAVWLDNPANFSENRTFENKDGGPDDAFAVVAGEDGLSSTAMESFTQKPTDQPNCFSCHNTKEIDNDSTGAMVLKGKRLNVSHILSRFLLGEE